MQYMFLLLKILTAIVCTEALTELAVKSEFFQPLRAWLYKSNHKVLQFAHSVFDCGYCFSVWAAALSTLLIFCIGGNIINLLVLIVVIHRLSNLFHFFIDAVRGTSRL